MVKRFSITLDDEIYDALEKERKKNLGINRSRMIEVILEKALKVRKKCKWWSLRRFWR